MSKLPPREVTRTDLPQLRPPAQPTVDPSDLAINALHHPQDRAALMCDEARLLLVLRTFEQIERTVDDQDLEIALLRRKLAEAKAQAEREAINLAQSYEAELLRLRQLNAQRCSELDTARRLNLLLTEQHHAVLAELLDRDETEQVRSVVPPADDDPFGEPAVTRVWPSGTNPDNETVVVDVPFGGSR